MTAYSVQDFMAEVCEIAVSGAVPADCVQTLAPKMQALLMGGRDFLEPRHFRADPETYARNAVFITENDGPSLFTLVWNPGQWTPIHDHGTWGVVGVLKGVLEERNLIREDQSREADEGITLLRGGIILLAEGTVTSFVPNPDHIHRTGVPEDREQVVSLHLYGRTMDNFHIYDREAGTRRLIAVAHNES